MLTGRLPLIAISFFLIIGGVYPHICEISCVYSDGKISSSMEPVLNSGDSQQQTSQTERCHESESTKKPNANRSVDHQNQDSHFPQCQIHADAGAVESSVDGKLLSDQLFAHSMIESGLDFDPSIYESDGIIGNDQLFKSPPARAVFSILRI